MDGKSDFNRVEPMYYEAQMLIQIAAVTVILKVMRCTDFQVGLWLAISH